VYTTSAAYLAPSSISNLLGVLLCEVNITEVCRSGGAFLAGIFCDFLVDELFLFTL
jgi:hypothetical protein